MNNEAAPLMNNEFKIKCTIFLRFYSLKRGVER